MIPGRIPAVGEVYPDIEKFQKISSSSVKAKVLTMEKSGKVTFGGRILAAELAGHLHPRCISWRLNWNLGHQALQSC